MLLYSQLFFFFFNDTATTEIYTLSLHDALPIWTRRRRRSGRITASPSTASATASAASRPAPTTTSPSTRSEEHTSELQSRQYLVCRLLLEKKKKIMKRRRPHNSNKTHQ